MIVQTTQGRPTERLGNTSVGLPNAPPLGTPTTVDEAREMGETAVRFGLASIVFGIVLLALLPKS